MKSAAAVTSLSTRKTGTDPEALTLQTGALIVERHQVTPEINVGHVTKSVTTAKIESKRMVDVSEP